MSANITAAQANQHPDAKTLRQFVDGLVEGGKGVVISCPKCGVEGVDFVKNVDGNGTRRYQCKHFGCNKSVTIWAMAEHVRSRHPMVELPLGQGGQDILAHAPRARRGGRSQGGGQPSVASMFGVERSSSPVSSVPSQGDPTEGPSGEGTHGPDMR